MSADEQFITLERDGAVGIIRINRPPANSYNTEYMRQLDRAVDEAGQDAGVRAVVVASALEKFFSAGADVNALTSFTSSDFDNFVLTGHRVLNKIEQTPKVFIAVINGHTIGGGFEIALACDFRFAGEGAYRIGFGEVNLGQIPGMGGTQRFPRLVGKAKALGYMVTGEFFGPDKAYELGAVDRLYPAGEVLEQALQYARKLADGPTKAIGLIKVAVNEGMQTTLQLGLEIERHVVAQNATARDREEGMAAFREKRAPVFVGE